MACSCSGTRSTNCSRFEAAVGYTGQTPQTLKECSRGGGSCLFAAVLSTVIDAWAEAKRLEAFFADAERRAQDLTDEQRERTIERLRQAASQKVSRSDLGVSMEVFQVFSKINYCF